MSSFLTFLTLLVMGLVAIVLVRGLFNMAKGGSGNTSNKLMQLRVLLQAIAIALIMLTLWLTEYERRLKRPPSAECQKTVHFVLERNILNGNALSMKKVDASAQDTQEPILFSEWSAVGGTLIKRRDFHQDELLRDQSARTSLEQAEGELSLQYVPKSPTREFPPMDYRKLPEAES